MSKAMKLRVIADEMAALATKHGGDPEGQHVEADDLLVRALLTVVGDHAEWRPIADRIVKDYEALEKWYA